MDRPHPARDAAAAHAPPGAGWHDIPRRFRLAPLTILAAPALLWLAATLYLPILVPTLAAPMRWLVALAVVALAGLSLAAHVLAHAAAARALGVPLPERLPLALFGDAAQRWPAAPRARDEALIALAGPAANAALGALAALLWQAPLGAVPGALVLFVAVGNGALAAANLAPAYPFDGGRLLRLALVGAARRPARVSAVAGWAMAGALLAWGAAVVATRSRLSGETGAALGGAAALIALALAAHRPQDVPALDRLGGRVLLRRGAAVLLGAVLCVPALALIPMPHGLYAPGGAVPVAPMVEVSALPPDATQGELLLTTVVGQTPILALQWLAGQVDPAVTIVPPEQVVPPETTPQGLMADNARMLAESEIVATVVGLRMAGYDAVVTGSGARVLEVFPESPAHGLLQPDDRIVALDGASVRTASELLLVLGELDPGHPVVAEVRRGNAMLRLQLPLLPPTAPEGPPRIGITIGTADLAVEALVPVRIQPHSIIGGPSAGLMFTLAIYDRLTPGDLTGGQRIAGTGTVSPDGQVGPIGGVAQKVAAAERAGATYFLTPHENAADARRAARRITIIEVGSVMEAITALQSLAPAAGTP